MPPLLARVATKPTMAIRIDRRRTAAVRDRGAPRARPPCCRVPVRAAHAASQAGRAARDVALDCTLKHGRRRWRCRLERVEESSYKQSDQSYLRYIHVLEYIVCTNKRRSLLKAGKTTREH